MAGSYKSPRDVAEGIYKVNQSWFQERSQEAPLTSLGSVIFKTMIGEEIPQDAALVLHKF